ncbi:MAG TPA: cyclase family protein [Clostridium sp.]
MKIIDLSHVIHSKILVFPGTEEPKLEQATTFEKHGFVENKVAMYTHTGTHIDAPYHILEDGLTIDKYDVEDFVGKAQVIDFTDFRSKLIDVEDLVKYEDLIADIEYLIIKTGWGKYWGDEKYFNGFPVLTTEAAEWLLKFNLKGIGVDAISVDPVEAKTFPCHRILFKKSLIIIENLANLDEIGDEPFILSCLPLKFKDADGSPVRAVAMMI